MADELVVRPLSNEDDEELNYFSMTKIEVDGISASRVNGEGRLSISTNPMFGIKSDGDYEPYVDGAGNVYYEFDSPYMCEFGDPINEEEWLKHGTIVTVNGYYL